jgi:macrolide transport system ATP-binding/permease protein
VASSTHLRADGISHGYGDRRVLTDVCLVADARERIGIIGENGAGKSTLLRVLAGVEAPDAGTVVRPASIGLLQQELPFRPSQTLDDVLEHALRAVRHAESQLGLAAEALAETALAKPALAERDDADPAEVRYAAALAHAEAIDVWGADSRRDTALAGLGLAGIDRSRRISEVSGGQRSRLALAALLLAQPEALLLDEPTNHLDDSATDYLRAQLVEWPGVVVFASHDRAFLDEVATSVIDLDPRADDTARRFGGTFSDYLEAKSAERMRWDDRYAAEQQEIARLHDQVAVTSRQIAHDRPKRDNEKMGYDATAERVQGQISRRVRSARSRLDQLEVAQVARPPAPLTFAGIPHGTNPLPADSGVLVELDEVGAVGRLEPVSLSIEPRSRILVTGPNGAGKSTLLAVLAGHAVPGRSGRERRRKALRVGLLTQDVDLDDPAGTPRTLYERAVGERTAERLPLASLGLLAARDLDRPAGELSVGQQRRLALAFIVARPPQLLLLDEPTNHLSLALAGELEAAFGEYPGAIVVASHDRWLRRRWDGEVLRLTPEPR